MSRQRRWALWPLVVLLTCVVAVRPAFGDIFYVYDDVGRLIVVMDSNGAAVRYTYDAVGNLLSITRFTLPGPPSTEQAPPVLTNIVPAEADAGSSVSLILTGQSLLSTQAVTSDNPGVSIQAASVTSVAPDRLTVVVAIAVLAPVPVLPGTLTVRTAFGSASIAFTVTQPPVVLTRLDPNPVTQGDLLTIEGSGLISPAGPTSVSFAGANDGRVLISGVAATLTQLRITVPFTAVSGDVQVAVGPKVSDPLPLEVLAGESGSG